MNFLRFGQSADIDIIFDGAENRQQAEIKTEDGKKDKYLLYYDGETVGGKVNITLKKPGSKLEHQGIKIELIGQIELYYDRGNHHDFLSLVRELARPGDLIQNTSYPFEFANVEKPYEVYVGSNVRLRYFLRVTIVRRLSDIVREVDVAVHTLSSYPDTNSPIKMEVGIEDCLHIEFEYNKSKYHLKDVIVGKIYFLLVRIKIKHMEIAIIKREQTGSGPNMYTENEIIAKYEIMDGSPVKGESIPIRVFLAGYDLTVTMREINKKFSVRYFLNLVLIDTEDRRYFKQQEITLWRKAEKTRKSLTPSQAAAIAAAQGGGAAIGGLAPGQLAAVTGSSNNPHIPHHLVGQGTMSSLGSKDLTGGGTGVSLLGDGSAGEEDEGNVKQRPDESNPIMGLFTEDSSQADLRPKPTARQRSVDTLPSSSDQLPDSSSRSAGVNSNLKSGELPLHVEPDDDSSPQLETPQPQQPQSQQQQQQQQQHLHREAGDGAASISQTTDEETSSLFDANDLSFNAAPSSSNTPAAATAATLSVTATSTAATDPTSSPTISSSVKQEDEPPLVVDDNGAVPPVVSPRRQPDESLSVTDNIPVSTTNDAGNVAGAPASPITTSSASPQPQPSAKPAKPRKPVLE
ncbi:vacuolar protein sorting-associated protein 26B-like [Anopheles ziemanni]|uniref:vacuolar protein sorting-associated protein 26B-like n=1 Tax=Anopheles coustani TaxID=139045 RepID=UPI0026580602|nr:vacuolar protein sorting-associated protein 26B-like [Anopheles coustani]XP_058168459.1 vacuolar protein sorting-associated protein 26B-like [Anopheles ziemanni]